MSLEPIGVITLLIGAYCMISGIRATVMSFVLLCTLGSAAALLLGGANVQPSHLFLVFLAAVSVTWRKIANNALTALRFSEPGFWLLCLVLYGILSSYLMPRLFLGNTYIVPLGSTGSLITSSGIVPLEPVSSNITQSIYLLGDLACFIIIIAIGSTIDGFKALATALIAYAVANLFFGAVDIATSATGTQDSLKFIRNAQYTFHDEESVGDMRRIIGSWPEASAFAAMTLGALGFTGTMWLYGRSPKITGPLAFLSLVFVLLSTSSTGIVGSIAVIVLLYVVALTRCGTRYAYRFSSAYVIFTPLFAVLILLIVLSNDTVYTKLSDYINTLVFDKANSESGMQRASWNYFAWLNFLDTWGLGVGLGTNRTSSFIMAVLSNLGIPGAIFYSIFITISFGIRRGISRSYFSDIRMAATISAMSLLIAAVIAGPTVDMGLLFYILAGVAASVPERNFSNQGHILEV